MKYFIRRFRICLVVTFFLPGLLEASQYKPKQFNSSRLGILTLMLAIPFLSGQEVAAFEDMCNIDELADVGGACNVDELTDLMERRECDFDTLGPLYQVRYPKMSDDNSTISWNDFVENSLDSRPIVGRSSMEHEKFAMINFLVSWTAMLSGNYRYACAATWASFIIDAARRCGFGRYKTHADEWKEKFIKRMTRKGVKRNDAAYLADCILNFSGAESGVPYLE